ncbi:MAG: pyruvate dehydrogenase (acetyl-transferring) E1 component subunit alpha [Myxococcota bacterium]
MAAAVQKPNETPLVRVLDDEGRVRDPKRDPEIATGDLKRIYRHMVLLRHLDERLLRMQRQGRLGFYMTSTGEEATQLGSAWALADQDWIFPSYREPGVALWRGYGLEEFFCQLFGNAADPLKGRQMPVHHSVARIHFVSISSPVGTQIPQAVGAARAAQIRRDGVAVATYFGDGATSTSDFHVGLNFAGVWRAPCVFVCRNNGWAISVPLSKQTGSATIAQKAFAYGIPGVRVDGNDALAVASVMREALERARAGEGPTLIEAVTYRRGPHSSSDDPSAYRDPSEPKRWEKRDPVERFRKHLHARELWSEAWEKELVEEIQRDVAAALEAAEAMPPKPPVASMFEDVYREMPWHLAEQRDALQGYLARRGPVGEAH